MQNEEQKHDNMSKTMKIKEQSISNIVESTPPDILHLTAVQLGKKIQSAEITAIEATKSALAQIKKAEPFLNSFITVDEEGALKQAEEIQKKIESGELTGPLAGVPMAVKDNICTENLLTTCGSKILDGFIPSYSSEAVLNLQKAGAIILGKTNMDEFAMGSTTETSYYKETKNPWNIEYVPGGSSGGSCTAVAAEECFYALGSDTGGSIRQPSSFCGVTGLKPTYGRVSRYGLIAYASSLDQIGPIAKDVTDCATILEIITSYDKKDSTSIAISNLENHAKYSTKEVEKLENNPMISCPAEIVKNLKTNLDTKFTDALVADVKGMRIGIPKSYFSEGLDIEVKEAVLKAAQVLREQGAIVEEFDLDLVEYAVPAYYVIASAEASSNLSRFDGVKYGYRTQEYQGLHQMYKKTRSEGFGTEVKRRIMLGSFVLSSGYYEDYYLKALRTRTLIKQEFDKIFANYDVILTPVAPTTAPKLGENLMDPMKMYLSDIYTVSVNLAGLPAISIPCGTDSKGLPIGLQLIADCFMERKIIQAAYTYEQTREYERCPILK